MSHHPYLDDDNFSVSSSCVSLVSKVLSHFIIKAVCLLVPGFNEWGVFGVQKRKHAMGVERGDNIDGIEFVLPARNNMERLRC